MRPERDDEEVMAIISGGAVAANSNDRRDLLDPAEIAVFTGSEKTPETNQTHHHENHQDKALSNIEWTESNDGRKLVKIGQVIFDREHLIWILDYLRTVVGMNPLTQKRRN